MLLQLCRAAQHLPSLGDFLSSVVVPALIARQVILEFKKDIFGFMADLLGFMAEHLTFVTDLLVFWVIGGV